MIRRAIKEDVPRIIELGFQEYLEEQAYMLGLNYSFMTVHFGFNCLIDNENLGSLLVAEEDGQVVAFYSSMYQPNVLDHLQYICTEIGWYVCPEYRGKGIGKALLKETMRLSLEKGVTMKKVGAAIGAPAGQRLMEWYIKQGFVVYQGDAFKHISKEDT